MVKLGQLDHLGHRVSEDWRDLRDHWDQMERMAWKGHPVPQDLQVLLE